MIAPLAKYFRDMDANGTGGKLNLWCSVLTIHEIWSNAYAIVVQLLQNRIRPAVVNLP